MRARHPDRLGLVHRNGVGIAYEVFGRGSPAVLLVPPSPIAHARAWKAVVPTLARRYTVVTTDGVGTGRSDRPHASERYAPAQIVADLVAVLDAAEIERAVVVAHCHAVAWALQLAAEYPDRVAGVVAIEPGIAVAPGHPHWAGSAERGPVSLDAQIGWAMCDREFWRTPGGYRRWVEFFFDQQLPEPHSTKQFEDAVRWALDTGPEEMIAGDEGEDALPTGDDAESLCARVSCSVLVIHGDDDRCQPLARGRRLAELTNAELVVLRGAGHLPHARHPVLVIRLITAFLDKVTPVPMRTRH